MGLYVNPTRQSKERWVQQNAKSQHRTGDAVIGARHAEILRQGLVPLVLVDNGIFTALGVLYSQQEAEGFAREDGRPKLFITVDRAALADDASGVGEQALQSFGI
jgi:hypothetical protein